MMMIPHIGYTCPVGQFDVVVYRTLGPYPGCEVSAVHLPILAMRLDWSARPTMGHIHDYAVIRRR